MKIERELVTGNSWWSCCVVNKSLIFQPKRDDALASRGPMGTAM